MTNGNHTGPPDLRSHTSYGFTYDSISVNADTGSGNRYEGSPLPSRRHTEDGLADYPSCERALRSCTELVLALRGAAGTGSTATYTAARDQLDELISLSEYLLHQLLVQRQAVDIFGDRNEIVFIPEAADIDVGFYPVGSWAERIHAQGDAAGRSPHIGETEVGEQGLTDARSEGEDI